MIIGKGSVVYVPALPCPGLVGESVIDMCCQSYHFVPRGFINGQTIDTENGAPDEVECKCFECDTVQTIERQWLSEKLGARVLDPGEIIDLKRQVRMGQI